MNTETVVLTLQRR